MNQLLKIIKAFIKNDDPEAQLKWRLYGRVWHELGKPYWKLLLAGVVMPPKISSL